MFMGRSCIFPRYGLMDIALLGGKAKGQLVVIGERPRLKGECVKPIDGRSRSEVDSSNKGLRPAIRTYIYNPLTKQNNIIQITCTYQ